MQSESLTCPPIFSASDLRRIRAFVSAQLEKLPVDQIAQQLTGSAPHASNGQTDKCTDGERSNGKDQEKSGAPPASPGKTEDGRS